MWFFLGEGPCGVKTYICVLLFHQHVDYAYFSDTIYASLVVLDIWWVMAKKRTPVVMSVEGSSSIILKLPKNNVMRAMTLAETYLASCYAIWVAANEDHDPRALELKSEIMRLTLEMLNETDSQTIH